MAELRHPILDTLGRGKSQFPSLERPEREESFVRDKLPILLAVASGLFKGISGSEGIRRRAMPETRGLVGEITAGKAQREKQQQQQWAQDMALEIQKVGFEAAQKQQDLQNVLAAMGFKEGVKARKGTEAYRKKTIGIEKGKLGLAREELDLKKRIADIKAGEDPEHKTIASYYVYLLKKTITEGLTEAEMIVIKDLRELIKRDELLRDLLKNPAQALMWDMVPGGVDAMIEKIQKATEKYEATKR